MPDRKSPDQEPEKRRQFIREKVVKPPLTPRQIAKRFMVFIFIAAVGGAAAGISFAIAKPMAEKYLIPSETTESIPVTIPKDEPETSPPETEPATTEMQEIPETEPVEEMIQSALEEYEYTIDDYNTIRDSLRKVASEADKGIVVVHSVKKEVDWFDNPMETAGLYAGVIIAATNQEVLILTPDSAVENADSIKVTFIDGTEADGAIKQTDMISGMAIVSVGAGTLEEDTKNSMAVLQLGNSYTVKQGDTVIALGAPSGMIHSSAYGVVSYVLRNVQVADGVTRLLYVDISSSAQAGTFLVNLSGEVIGWVSDEYQSEGAMISALAISDYKAILERMSNGAAAAYLGIKGQEVSAAMAEGGMPLGVYVVDCITDGPAYNAGIQNGDIIVKVGDKNISTMKDYQNQVESLNPEEEIPVVVQRNGIDEYKELEYQVTVGAR